MNKILPSVIFVAFSSLPLILNYIRKRKYRKLMEAIKTEDDYYHQCMFLNMNNFNCRQHLIDRNECSEYCSYARLNTLINFISSAKVSICLCVYMLTLHDVILEVIKAHKKGVYVRVITDAVMLKTDVSKFNFTKLKDNKIQYKVQPFNQSMMHHKFCLIDKEDKGSAKMFFGTMNLTRQGLVSNFDNIILTNNWNIIERFNEEFEELWETF